MKRLYYKAAFFMLYNTISHMNITDWLLYMCGFSVFLGQLKTYNIDSFIASQI